MYQFSERIHSLDYFVQAINHSNETVTKLILATLVLFMTKQRPDMDDIAHSHRRHFLYTYVIAPKDWPMHMTTLIYSWLTSCTIYHNSESTRHMHAPASFTVCLSPVTKLNLLHSWGPVWNAGISHIRSIQFNFTWKLKTGFGRKKSRIPNGAHLLDEGIQNISTHGKASFDWIGFFPESCEII